MQTAIITDSTCDLPQALLAEHTIYVVPQYVIWGDEELNDLTDITAEIFFERLQTDPVAPKTSRPTPQDFLTLIEQARQAGAEEIVTILVSDKLSGSVGSARIVQQEVDIPFHIVDSKAVSAALGFQVLAAARARAQGADTQGIITAAEEARRTMRMFFTVDTLDYLHRGGRIGAAQRWIGTALNIKPALYVDIEKGEVAPGERTRTRKRAIEHLYQSFFEGIPSGSTLHVAVVHAVVDDEAQALAERIRTEHNPAELLVTSITPAIGVHAGPGVLGVGGFYTQG
ncbi:MAG: DegV family protein [Chloroflexi bacterium]|nr:DegV family protein [Chloroflexota bacterium]